ncbi:hypothetical protein F5J12DRAFT_786070 [Pisolithus orientalis]|uniref:uncharacterized protein n=1 Tax=Pisolithus orientalis TaxID=936130 RepID=UPI0022256E87|nr:uncharacterized protein F5J12DRAFT_786070 [Pisolithus orientalis]KAI5993083.1 hypothetical protein F5J12DRAFT_786070 [Pisolithus orientalis]
MFVQVFARPKWNQGQVTLSKRVDVLNFNYGPVAQLALIGLRVQRNEAITYLPRGSCSSFSFGSAWHRTFIFAILNAKEELTTPFASYSAHLQYYLEQYGISGVPNDAIVGLGCRKLMKGGTCSSSTQLGWCDLSSYVAPHIYTSCEMNAVSVSAVPGIEPFPFYPEWPVRIDLSPLQVTPRDWKRSWKERRRAWVRVLQAQGGGTRCTMFYMIKHLASCKKHTSTVICVPRY